MNDNITTIPTGLFEIDDGRAQIKSEFLISSSTNCISETEVDQEKGGTVRGGTVRGAKRKRKGQNKHRGPTYVQPKETKLCSVFIDVDESVAEIPVCTRENCPNMHDVEEYLKNKLPDLGDSCYVYESKGHCPWGITCRYGKHHITSNGRNMKDRQQIEAYENSGRSDDDRNCFSFSKDLMTSLRKKTYDFSASNLAIKQYDDRKVSRTDGSDDQKYGCFEDTDLISLRQDEKKKIMWNDKLYLAPLTTVGNLPFRRICKEYGADVTCSEMVLSTSIITGTNEWTLCKRHHTEDLFGIQIGGNNPYTLTKCFQVLQEQAEVDFIDLNLGCPTEQICLSGSGCGLMMRKNVLRACVQSMSSVANIPFTIKCRTGFYRDEKIALKFLPLLADSNISLVTIHGRTKEQMYSKQANWQYINECSESVKDIPIFGNGDILSFTDYNFIKEHYPSVSGVMIARGALYKPWIFTEIKEQRHWDVSSSDRMDILKKYVHYGLEHWGSDTRGVENVRRFLLEWLSFLHRYIPVGLLERVPQHINQRPPTFIGRNDLETMFASSKSQDWIRISEMLLGPVPPNFTFVPKHKANFSPNDMVEG